LGLLGRRVRYDDEAGDVLTDHEARAFKCLGITPDEACALGTTPAAAWSYKQAGFSIAAAQSWLWLGSSAEEADVWSRAGWAPEQAQQICAMYDEARGARWRGPSPGLSAPEAIHRATARQSPLPFLPLPRCEPPQLDANNDEG
jgi:hypothetical protein